MILIRSAPNGGCSEQTRTPESLMSSMKPESFLMSCSDSSKYSISIASDTYARGSFLLSAPSNLPILNMAQGRWRNPGGGSSPMNSMPARPNPSRGGLVQRTMA